MLVQPSVLVIMADKESSNAGSSVGFERFWTALCQYYQPIEFRSNVKLWSAAMLAAALWLLLGKIVWGQFQYSQAFASKIARNADSVTLVEGRLNPALEARIQLIKQANDMVGTSAQSLYTFLTPIVTAVTGYFFVATSNPATKLPAKPGNPLLGSDKRQTDDSET